jgi:hypothetical protein
VTVGTDEEMRLFEGALRAHVGIRH